LFAFDFLGAEFPDDFVDFLLLETSSDYHASVLVIHGGLNAVFITQKLSH
jgi:hypothetical protein